jgi:predicted MFS family arabinose efflux permease
MSDTRDGMRWVAFLLVCAAYLAVTAGESILSPIYPLVADDLDLDLAQAGLAFAVLAVSIAIFNIVGGLLLRRLATNRVLTLALLTTAVGSAIASTADGRPAFYVAQVFLGAGAGGLYAGGVMAVGVLAGPERRGRAMAVFGVFFSGGLVLAAGLAALGTQLSWRWTYGIAALLAALAAMAMAGLTDMPRAATAGPLFSGLRAVLGTPTLVGVVAGVSQYATVSFLPVFAVDVWDLSEAGAAGLLAIGRVLSVPAKLVSGAAADRIGPTRTGRLTGIVLAGAGLVWALAPTVWIAAAAAVVFTAEVSALFPLANLLAFERVGTRTPALGAFRSLQLGSAALAGVVIGAAAEAAGLRPTVAVVGALPVVLVASSSRTVSTPEKQAAA